MEQYSSYDTRDQAHDVQVCKHIMIFHVAIVAIVVVVVEVSRIHK